MAGVTVDNIQKFCISGNSGIYIWKKEQILDTKTTPIEAIKTNMREK